ncbi:GAP family protein [Janibacter sp. GS2]|uniref:GAP family protein n=1 Tax=Janibacter sp. GS2 TaxID=3442646 RepID=UPI003EBBD844
MGDAIGEILPLALGITISPIPIIAAILMLLSPRAKRTSVGFLLGWVLGIILAVGVFTLISQLLPEDDPAASAPIAGSVKILLGLLLLLLAGKQWGGRPTEGESPQLPGWMKAIDTMTAAKATGLGFLLSALNPKNLIMGAGAGVAVGGAGLGSGQVTLVIAMFTVVAAASVAVPVIAYLVAATRMGGPLDVLRQWLTKENSVVMATLLVVMGVVMIGKGIGNF